MKLKLTPVPPLCAEDLTDREALLVHLLSEREEYIQQLIDENARLKGEKGKPKIKPSRLEPDSKAPAEEENDSDKTSESKKPKKKRPGSAKRHKTASLTIHETKIIQPTQPIPAEAEFKGYQDYTVQGLIIKTHNTCYRLAMWKTPTGEYLKGKLPESVRRLGHFDATLRSYLQRLGITKEAHVKTTTEGALLGAVLASGVSSELGIISDGAGQFRLLNHGLCWVHAERLVNKLIPLTEAQRLAVETVQDQIWQLYQDLKAYKSLTPEQQQQTKAGLSARFDQIFTGVTGFEFLNQVLSRLARRKEELLLVLERPDLPIHNNASEQDIREFVRKRKISGSTRSNEGRRCRDTFASLKKTCRKLRVSFWEYLSDRVCDNKLIPPLGELIAQKARSLGTLADIISLSVA